MLLLGAAAGVALELGARCRRRSARSRRAAPPRPSSSRILTPSARQPCRRMPGAPAQVLRRGDRGVGDLGGAVHVVDHRAEAVSDALPSSPPSCEPRPKMIRSAECRAAATTSSPRSRIRWSITGTTTSAVARCARRCERRLGVEAAPQDERRAERRADQRRARSRGRGTAARHLGRLPGTERHLARAGRRAATATAARRGARPSGVPVVPLVRITTRAVTPGCGGATGRHARSERSSVSSRSGPVAPPRRASARRAARCPRASAAYSSS